MFGGLLNGEIRGEMAKPALGLRRRDGDLLLGRRYDASALFFEGDFAVLLVLNDLLLDVAAKFRDFLVETGQLRFDGAEAGIGVQCDLAGRFKIVTHLLRALAQQHRETPAERDQDGKKDDGRR